MPASIVGTDREVRTLRLRSAHAVASCSLRSESAKLGALQVIQLGYSSGEWSKVTSSRYSPMAIRLISLSFAFGVELDLRMLVDRAERLDRRLTGEDHLVVHREPLAEALRPELSEPVRQAEERVGVRHRHQDRLVEPWYQPRMTSPPAGRRGSRARRGCAASAHGAGPARSPPMSRRKGRRQQADGAEHRHPAIDSVRAPGRCGSPPGRRARAGGRSRDPWSRRSASSPAPRRRPPPAPVAGRGNWPSSPPFGPTSSRH